MHGLNNSADLAMATADCSICQKQRPTLSSLCDSGVIRWLPVANRLHWTISIARGWELCSCWNSHLVRIWFCLPGTQWFCQNYQMGTYRILYTPSQYSMKHCLWSQRTHFIANGVQQWLLYVHEIHWSYHVFSSPWISWLDRIVEWPFEDSVIAPAI